MTETMVSRRYWNRSSVSRCRTASMAFRKGPSHAMNLIARMPTITSPNTPRRLSPAARSFFCTRFPITATTRFKTKMTDMTAIPTSAAYL